MRTQSTGREAEDRRVSRRTLWFALSNRPLVHPVVCLVLWLCGSLLLTGPLSADERVFTPVDAATTRRVAQLIAARHWEQQPIDDAVSAELFDDFLSVWDPQRLYLTQADVDELTSSRLLLDDQIKAGELQFPQRVFAQVLSRCRTSQAMALAVIDAEHDFSVVEQVRKDTTERPWAATPAQLQEYWRKTIKQELLEQMLAGESLERARVIVKRRYQTSWNLLAQTDRSELLETFLSTMMRCLDPHSRYFSPRQEDEFQVAMSLRLTGIGARLRHDAGQTVVEELIRGGAADADGRLQPEDIIVAIGQGESGPVEDIVGRSLQSVVGWIRGAEGTLVRLHVRRAGQEEPLVFTLKRQRVELQQEQVQGEIVETSTWQMTPARKIGVLTVPSFYRDFRAAAVRDEFRSVTRDTRVILQTFRDADVDAVVVDIRNNTGGALAEAVAFTGLFLADGPIVQMRSRGLQPEVLRDTDEQLAWEGPLVVLINRQTASASEIFAAAVKDYRRGLVLGDSHTHGKGSLQNIIDIRTAGDTDQGAIKLTVGTWHGVQGASPQVCGVAADIVLPSLTDLSVFGEAALEHPVANMPARSLIARPSAADEGPSADDEGLSASGEGPAAAEVSPELIARLQQKSGARVQQQQAFRLTAERMKLFQQDADRKFVSLHRPTREARQAEYRATEVTAPEDVQSEADDRLFAAGFYNREVIRTTLDLLEAVRGN